MGEAEAIGGGNEAPPAGLAGAEPAGRGARPGSGPLVPAERFVRANGLRFRVLEWLGPLAPCPPVVILHGVLQTAEGMDNLAAHLARRSRVIAPDLRGRGGSDRPPDGYDPATMAADVAALIETLGLDRPVVIGRLHGGLVAYHLAAARPDLVRGLVLGDTTPEVDERRARRALETIRALPPRFASLDEALAYYQSVLLLSEARARHDIPFDLMPDGQGGYRWRHDLALVERIEAATLPRCDWPILERVRCPTLLLRGQRGEVTPAVAAKFCDHLRGCQIQTLLGARHDVFLGPGAEQAFAAVALFLMRLGDGPAPRQANFAPAADAPGSQLPLPGAEPTPTTGGDGAALVERIVRALNSRDPAAVAALFALDGRITQYGEGGLVRSGGLETAQAAFSRVFAAEADVAVEARDVVASGDRAACVFVVRAIAAPPGDDGTFAPLASVAAAFLRARAGW